MSVPNAKASSSIVRGLNTASSSAIAAVVGYTAISTKLSALASVNSSAAGSSFTATKGCLRVVDAGTKKASAVSSAQTPEQGSAKVAAAGSALASDGTAASSAVTAPKGSASAVIDAGSASDGTLASSALGTTRGSDAVGATRSALVSAGTVENQGYAELAFALGALTLAGVRIYSAFGTDPDSAAAATAGNTKASDGVATSSVVAVKGSTVAAGKEDNTEAVTAGDDLASADTVTKSVVVAAKEDNTEVVTERNDLASVGPISGSAISAVKGTPAYIAATKHQPSTGYASTSAFLQSAAAKGISASSKIILLMPEKTALGAGVAVAGAIVYLQAAGFTVGGITAGSAAAAVQSVLGDVAKGSIFALLQSKGTIGEAIAVIL